MKSAVPPLSTKTALPPRTISTTSSLRSVRHRPDVFAASAWDKSSTFRILSLDGGGARGIMEAVLLARLEEKYPNFLSDRVDLIAGTSTGGLLTLLLASGRTAKECVEAYREWMPRVFASSYRRILLALESAKYSEDARLEAVEHFFGDMQLGDLQHHVAIPAFRVNGTEGTCSFFPGDHWRPAIFSTLPKGQSDVQPDNNRTCVCAAMATSAAPTFFPVWRSRTRARGYYVDGGVFANNPALMATAKVFDCAPHVTRSNLRVLSVGTGHFDVELEDDLKAGGGDWGLRAWASSIVELLMAGQAMSADQTMKMLVGERGYHRLDVHLSRKIGLDEVEAVDEMVDMANAADLTAVCAWIDDNFPSRRGPAAITE